MILVCFGGVFAYLFACLILFAMFCSLILWFDYFGFAALYLCWSCWLWVVCIALFGYSCSGVLFYSI